MIVAKIGGSCISDSNDLKKVVVLVAKLRENGDTLILVISALRGVTNDLIALQSQAIGGEANISKLSDRHFEALQGLSPVIQVKAWEDIRRLLKEVDECLSEISTMQRAEAKTTDALQAYGEKLATTIIAYYLKDAGIDAKPLWGAAAGMISTPVFSDGILLKESASKIRDLFLGAKYIPVVAGFFGESEAGDVVILGRGASDYVATFISAALRALVVLYKDVDGIMTADPKAVTEARIVEKVSYTDAVELAYFGLKVINEKAIIPAWRANIPIRITNMDHPDAPGSTISSEGDATIISRKTGVAMIDLLNSDLEDDATITELLRCTSVKPILFSKISRSDYRLVIDEKDEAKIISKIKTAPNLVSKVDKNIELIIAIGSELPALGTSEILSSLGGIDVKEFHRSHRRDRVILMVAKDDTTTAMARLHAFLVK